MRRFAIGTLLILGLAAVGCEKPVDGIPGPSGSPVSSGDDLSVEMPTEGTPAPDAPAAPPADLPPADLPPAENAAPPVDPAKDAPATPATDAPAVEPKQSDARSTSGVKFVADTSLKVPTMTCPHGCWPTVKETLVAQPGVEAVELAKQSTDDSIDNPVVYIKTNGKFNAKSAVAALAKAGFDNAQEVN